ncbi:DUF488 domain-containing protein [Brachymonas sp. M4Q-1]|uniref:DUF488 domain-containing protein n=1 Tax=Brachymonas sp. M4Q-1 TaxID=3416906 RepID=UPI003CF54C81
MVTKTPARRIAIQRAYEDPTPHDGYRVLVDRFWPRGRSKEALHLDEWARDLAPQPELIHWFGHDPMRWDAFRAQYRAALAAPVQQERLRAVLTAAGSHPITLVYGAHDTQHNQAVVLAEVLAEIDAA